MGLAFVVALTQLQADLGNPGLGTSPLPPWVPQHHGGVKAEHGSTCFAWDVPGAAAEGRWQAEARQRDSAILPGLRSMVGRQHGH